MCGFIAQLVEHRTGIAEVTGSNPVKALGRVVRKPVNANPGLKVNRGINFCVIKVLSIAYVLRSLRLLILKTEGQKNINGTPC